MPVGGVRGSSFLRGTGRVMLRTSVRALEETHPEAVQMGESPGQHVPPEMGASAVSHRTGAVAGAQPL